MLTWYCCWMFYKLLIFSEWFGISCSEDLTRINRTELSDNNLHGSIPASVFQTQLWGFDLSDNAITGTLPRLPTTIWGMNFQNMQLHGSIPQHFGFVVKL